MLSCRRCKSPNDKHRLWPSLSSRRPPCRQQLQPLHHEHHPLSRSHFKSQQHSTEELTCHRCQAHCTHDRLAPTSCKVVRWPPLQEEVSRDRRLAQDAYAGTREFRFHQKTLNCFCSRNAYDREHHHMCLVKKTIGNRVRTLASSEVLNLPNTSRVFFSEVHYSSKVRLPSNPHTHALTIDAWHGCCLAVVLVLANIASPRPTDWPHPYEPLPLVDG
jgi:hypothetical protein